MKEIQEIVNAQIKSMSESGELQKQVEEGVKSAVNKAIERQFESYGNITKKLENAFEENLLLDNNSLDIPSLNAVMTEVVNSNINKFYKGQAAEKLHNLMQEKLSPLPNEMTLVDLINMICQEWLVDSYEEFDRVDDYATVEQEEKYCGMISFKIWKKKESSYGGANQPDLHLTFRSNRNNGEEWVLQGRHGTTNPYYLFDVDALIFKAYAQGVKFTGVDSFDEDECNLCLKDSDY